LGYRTDAGRIDGNLPGTFREKLKECGLKDNWLVISGAHKELIKAIQTWFIDCSWQHCKVHFIRNILAVFLSRGKSFFAEKLKQICLLLFLISSKPMPAL
jgi:transposase-like protein